MIEIHYGKDIQDKPISVKFLSREAGKGVFANKKFEFGDTIYIEEPVVSHRFVKAQPVSLRP